MRVSMNLLLFALLLVSGLALAGCKRQPEVEARSGPAAPAEPALPGPVRHVVALGDSLFAGYGLRPAEAYPVRLEAALRGQGLNVRITNAGVSGDTTADGLRRLAFTLNSQPARPDLVLISLGGNDMLRGLPPAQSRDNLEAILTELDRRRIPVLLMGMLTSPNMGRDYARAFDPIFPALARKHHAGLVPFFLTAVIDHPELRQADRMHPTAPGVEAIVKATQGVVAQALADTAKSP